MDESVIGNDSCVLYDTEVVGVVCLVEVLNFVAFVHFVFLIV